MKSILKLALAVALSAATFVPAANAFDGDGSYFTQNYREIVIYNNDLDKSYTLYESSEPCGDYIGDTYADIDWILSGHNVRIEWGPKCDNLRSVTFRSSHGTGQTAFRRYRYY